ncbi:alpha/beta fold hydrolase [Amycolatopsis sp. GM8]|uniref:alpha/beta hydrolase family protein n=1 Tax=Amycolatopsis sp. GM8 TaxID=2896530 RepID=UPI001F482AFE|nr:chlorophyllase [Amycolatopsis sp. GM8]
MNKFIDLAARIPVSPETPAVTYNPVTLQDADRPLPLELRLTLPAGDGRVPVILLSHGGGESRYLASKDGYSPLADFYASHGFAVIQPTHLSSKIGGLGLDSSAPGHSMFWRSRIDDMRLVLDRLGDIEKQARVAGRLDGDRIAIMGHSAGAQTAGLLMGASLPGEPSLLDPRIKAGVLLAPVGNGAGLLPAVLARYPELDLDFSSLTTRTLVVCGDEDSSPYLTSRGPAWHADPYTSGAGADALLTLLGGKHFLGGIMGYDLKETDDEDPERLAITQRMTWAYLSSALGCDDKAWPAANAALSEHCAALATVTHK